VADALALRQSLADQIALSSATSPHLQRRGALSHGAVSYIEVLSAQRAFHHATNPAGPQLRPSGQRNHPVHRPGGGWME
jgi:hypothetical protein